MTAGPPALADTHCHLIFSAFRADIRAVMKRASEAGIERILVPGIDLNSSQAAVRLAEQESMIFASVGVHPHDASGLDEAARRKLTQLATSPKVVAIGEIGLDYYRNLSPAKAQQEAFEWQLGLAKQLELPVVIHCRDAIDVVGKTLLKWSQSVPTTLAGRVGVMHSFASDAANAAALIEAGFFIGISGPVTFKNAEGLRQAVAEIPLNRLLTETDAPYLTPHPHRGKRNEPAYVKLVAEQIGKIHHVPYSDVAEQTFDNASVLFKWSHGFDNGYIQ